jgi:hypothetical protein
MRFEGLRRLSSLPAERLEAALKREHVSAVLPVSELGSGRATVLAATPGKLAIATLRRVAGHDRWIVRWAPWDAVRMPAEPGRPGAPGRVIDIGGRKFSLVLGARTGRLATRDFRRCLQVRRRSVARREVARAG